MSKINLTDATTLTNETSFVSSLNANNAIIETAIDNTLSLDGTSPNSMSANLDMNSNRIINLPTPVLSNDPVRLQDMVTFTGGGTIAAFPTTSAGIASAISDETGTGSLVFATSPTLVTPTLGAATATSLLLTGSTPISLTVANAGIELGNTASSNTPFIDFHSSGNAIDFDARLIANGGTGVSGNGAISIVAGNFLPGANDSTTLGTASLSFSDLFLASGGVINWNAGDVTATHSSNALAFAGATNGYSFDTNVNTSTYVKTTAPSTQTNDFTVADTQNYIICNKGSTLTITLPAAASYTGRMLYVKTLQAFTVVSATSNVCPNTTNTPGTAILPGTAGAWCQMVSDGTNWIRMASSTIA